MFLDLFSFVIAYVGLSFLFTLILFIYNRSIYHD